MFLPIYYDAWEPSAPTDRLRSDCVHEQVAKRIANVRFNKKTDMRGHK